MVGLPQYAPRLDHAPVLVSSAGRVAIGSGLAFFALPLVLLVVLPLVLLVLLLLLLLEVWLGTSDAESATLLPVTWGALLRSTLQAEISAKLGISKECFIERISN